MRGMTWAMSCLILGNTLTPALAQPAEAAPQELQGTWSATKAERDGKGANDVVGHRLTFKGNSFEIRSTDGKLLFEGTYRMDTTTSPAAIDFQHTGGTLKARTWKGIYVLEGETLRICDNAPDPDKHRPAAFEAKAGSGHIFITFNRAKP